MDSTGSKDGKQTSSQRGHELGLLRALHVPSMIVDGDKISGAMSKAVLRTIDDHGKECWASAATIGRETCLSERTVRRAIKALEELGLITVESHPGQPSVIRIQWQNFRITQEALSEVESYSTPEALSATPEALSATPEALSDEALRSVKKRPKKRNTAKSISTNVDESLLSWITFWNSLKEKGLVSSGASNTPSQGVSAGFKRVSKSKELQELLADRLALEAKIGQSSFLKSATWFDLPKLLGGKNKDGEFIVLKIMNDGYANGTAHKKQLGYATENGVWTGSYRTKSTNDDGGF